MKTFLNILFCFILISFASYAEDKEKKVKIPYLNIKGFKYTQDQIDNLQTTLEYKKVTYIFTGGPRSIPMPEKEKDKQKLIAKYQKKGITPFRIFVTIKETEEVRGKKKTTTNYSGRCEIYVFDVENKKLVKHKRESLRKLCAT